MAYGDARIQAILERQDAHYAEERLTFLDRVCGDGGYTYWQPLPATCEAQGVGR